MRKDLADRFGVFGGILVNNMHNEDNFNSVACTNPFQPKVDAPYKSADKPFSMIRQDNAAYGDGTYFNRENNENSNMLINGMDNSLGDIARLMSTGEMRQPQNYGGLTFLPDIDQCKRQTQPLLIQTKDGKIHFRSDLKNIKMLSPTEYQQTVADPGANGYEELTYFKSLVLVFKLRVLSLFYSAQVEPVDAKREREISADEAAWFAKTKQPELAKQADLSCPKAKTKVKEESVNTVGLWRNNKPASVSTISVHSFLSQPVNDDSTHDFENGLLLNGSASQP